MRATRGCASAPDSEYATANCAQPATTERPQPRTILFSEGSSTSARQSLYALGRLGHTIDVCDSQRLALGRFSRYVRRWYVAPSFSADPAGYLDFLRQRLSAQRYDVLLPIHDQVFLLSRFRDEFASLVGLTVPSPEAIRQLQSKFNLVELLDRLGLAQPAYEIVAGCGQLKRRWSYPLFVKQEHGTAGRGVWRVETADAIQALARQLEARDAGDGPLLVQQLAKGQYQVLQAVFRQGALAAAHAYAGRAPGVGGSAHARLGLAASPLLEEVCRLARHLDWHGALHVEYFYDPRSGRAEIIEINPRIGETMNATLSGINLCQALVDVSLDRPNSTPLAVRPGMRTHSLLTSLLGAAERGAGRWQLLQELLLACQRRGVYAASEDELVRPAEDWLSWLPAAFVVARLLANPRAAEPIVRRAVANHSLNGHAAKLVEAMPRGNSGRDSGILVG